MPQSDSALPASSTSELKAHSLPSVLRGDIRKLNLTYDELVNQLAEAITEQNKLNAILRTIDNGVYAVDWDGKLVIFSAAAEKITGYSADEVLGQYCQDVLKIVNDKGESVCANCPLAQSMTTGKPVIYPLYFITAKSKRKIAAYGSYSSIKGLKNDVILGIGTFRDLRKEEELKKMKSDFVSMAAHELRTPLTSLRGYLSILVDEMKNISPEYQEFLQRSFMSATRMDTLVNNLLSVAKIERGALPLSLSEVQPEEIVEAVVAELKDKAQQGKITLSFQKLGIPLPKIVVDREKIREVLINLVDNAIKYSPNGGTITISANKVDNHLIIKVADTGIGLTNADKRRLFKKFSRVPKNAGIEVKGTGLGLYITKMIIKMHKGKIWVDSLGKGKGSTFFISLPLGDKRIFVQKYGFT